MIVSQIGCSYVTMDSLANYASDGDNSNNSDDAKVSNRGGQAKNAVLTVPYSLSIVIALETPQIATYTASTWLLYAHLFNECYSATCVSPWFWRCALFVQKKYFSILT